MKIEIMDYIIIIITKLKWANKISLQSANKHVTKLMIYMWL